MARSTLAHTPPLLPEKEVAALANELSGETAKRNLEGLARFHRQRGSQGFHGAAELVAERARAYGLSNVQVLQFPADGRIFYGTQKAREAWDAQEGELAELKDGSEISIASYAAQPIVLAEDSESANVTTELVDVGDGTQVSDYAGKDVKGKIVLVAAAAGSVQDIAVGQFNAAGIISYAQNQKTAWSGENDNLIRWGHLESFSPHKTFAFMISLQSARDLKARLQGGETIKLHARVTAGQHVASYEVVTATIEGADPKLKDSEIAFSCHLDHQRPGANDNASGCVTILEAARTLQKLINEGNLSRPARTIRFIWPPEVEGTVALLNAKPEFAQRIKTAIHMDMVGGGPDTKAVFHVTRGPMSLPSFVQDVAWAFASWVNSESYRFAAGETATYPMIAPEGGKEPLRAEYSAYTMGSDHDVYQDSSFGIPSIYLNDWPDRYIHTNFDTPTNIDPTKLKRAAFIGAASSYFLANFSPGNAAGARRAVEIGRLLRTAQMMEREAAPLAAPAAQMGATSATSTASAGASPRSPTAAPPPPVPTAPILDQYERNILNSITAYASTAAPANHHGPGSASTAAPTNHHGPGSASTTGPANHHGPGSASTTGPANHHRPGSASTAAPANHHGPGSASTTAPANHQHPGSAAADRRRSPLWRRRPDPRGPLVVFGYDYFADHAKAAGIPSPRLLTFEGSWGSGEEYAYEALNFADGTRSASQITAALSTEYGPVPQELVIEYLQALQKIGLLE